MGIKMRIAAVIICLATLLVGCNFNVSDINLCDVDLKQVTGFLQKIFLMRQNPIYY